MRNAVLLDTQILIWAVSGTSLSPNTISILQNVSELVVSPASVVEIRIKQSTNKLSLFDISKAIDDLGATVLPYNIEHALEYRVFNALNRDPFDNMLIATAVVEKLALLTSDKLILATRATGLKTIDANR